MYCVAEASATKFNQWSFAYNVSVLCSENKRGVVNLKDMTTFRDDYYEPIN